MRALVKLVVNTWFGITAGVYVESAAAAAGARASMMQNTNSRLTSCFLVFMVITMQTVTRSAQKGMKGCRQTVAFLVKLS